MAPTQGGQVEQDYFVLFVGEIIDEDREHPSFIGGGKRNIGVSNPRIINLIRREVVDIGEEARAVIGVQLYR